MRFGKNFRKIVIPEWRQCYLDYQILKIFIAIIKSGIEVLQDCDKAIEVFGSQEQLCSDHEQLVPWYKQELQSIKRELLMTIEQANRNFYQTLDKQMEIVQLFYQMKVLEIEDRYQVIDRLAQRSLSGVKYSLFLTYIEYVYVEISYLTQMREVNLQGERKILKKHKKNAKKLLPTPEPDREKIVRMVIIEEDYVNKIEDLYVDQFKKNKNVEGKDARQSLRNMASTASSTATDEKEYFYMGMGVGASIVVLGVMWFIMEYQGFSIENNSVFARDFPTWRGVAIYILYIWVLGFDLYCFETYKISHRLTFHFNDHHYSTSAQIFRLAGLYTSIFLVTFLIYLLCISEILHIEEPFRPQHLVLIVYISAFAYILAPCNIFNPTGRKYAFNLFLRSIASPLIGVDFTIVWMTDQWQSLITPMRDVAYTMCYYTRMDFDHPEKENPCAQASTFEVALLVVVVVISYRIVQCIRLGYDSGQYWCKPHMFNTIKYTLSLTSAILAYISNSDPELIITWISVSTVTTLYSYYWDLKMDWNLLECSDKSLLLRKYLTFAPARNYYIVIVLNFIMRSAWTMTLSPAIIASFGDKNLLTLVTGSIEIIRRGIWNLFRVQKEHLANCVEFKAIPDLKKLEDRLQEDLVPEPIVNVRNKEHAMNRQIVRKEFLQLINSKLQWREVDEAAYDDQYGKRMCGSVESARQSIREIMLFADKINLRREK